MSAVTLLCADHPLPLYDYGSRRTETSSHGGYTVSLEQTGFAVRAHEYYRPAVEELALDLKPCQYELDLRPTEEDAAAKGLMEYEGPAQQIRRDVHNFVVQSLDCRVLMELKENE